jgi:PAS domain-containing protein
MSDGVYAYKAASREQTAPAVRSGISLLWPALAVLSLALAIGAIIARVEAGTRFDDLLLFAAGAAAVVLALRLLVRDPVLDRANAAPVANPLKELLDSAGPGIVALDIHGRLSYVNPSAERMLGYHADELMRDWASFEIFAPGEGARLVAEIEKLSGVSRPPEPTPAGRLAAYMACAARRATSSRSPCTSPRCAAPMAPSTAWSPSPSTRAPPCVRTWRCANPRSDIAICLKTPVK